MTVDEVKCVYDKLKAQGDTDEDILAGLYLMFKHDELSYEELEAFSGILGFEMDEDFAKMSDEDKKKFGVSYDEEKADDVSKEEVEDAKEYEPEDKKEDSKEESESKSDEGSEEIEEKEEKEEVKEDKEDGKEESEEDEKEKAMKMFFNK